MEGGGFIGLGIEGVGAKRKEEAQEVAPRGRITHVAGDPTERDGM
jgi:hypothetical protein